MARGVICIFALLLGVRMVFGSCSLDVQNVTLCHFRYRCFETIDHVRLPDRCQASNNFPVYVDLHLTDPSDFELNPDTKDFIKNVITLRVTVNGPNAELEYLEHMTSLEVFSLVGSELQQIVGSPFLTNTQLQQIDLSHNRLTDVETLFEFEDQNNLRTLSLAFNEINELSNKAFSDLTSLVELDLSNNNLNDLTDEPFRNLTKLRTLKLTDNKIKNLNGALNHLQNLQHLYLGGNDLENIDEDSFVIIYHLETLDVSSNRLYQLKPDVLLRHWSHFQENPVCKINLSNNHITFLPNATFDVSFLPSEMNVRPVRHFQHKNEVELVTDLDLSNNMIEHVEYNAFHTIVHLTSLDLSHNKLIDFQVNEDDVVHLKFLNLSNNLLTSLASETFLPMTQLARLELSNNMIDSIPDEIFRNNIKLRSLNLAYNKISDLNNLHLSGMFYSEGNGFLDLSGNELSSINIPSDEALQLTTLSLHSNKIVDVSEVNLINTVVKYLILSNNAIERLDTNSLRLPDSLVSLDLSFNEIGQVDPSTFARFVNLVDLNLAHNRLNIFYNGAFHGLRQLKNLDLSDNQIHYLDTKSLNDLKALSTLSVMNNDMQFFDYNSWINHRTIIKVYIDGNNFTCDWVSMALREYDTGFSKVLPKVHDPVVIGDSFEGIPCEDGDVGELRQDDKLLLTAQKILEAIKNQTSYLKNYLWYNSQRQKQH